MLYCTSLPSRESNNRTNIIRPGGLIRSAGLTSVVLGPGRSEWHQFPLSPESFVGRDGLVVISGGNSHDPNKSQKIWRIVYLAFLASIQIENLVVSQINVTVVKDLIGCGFVVTDTGEQ